MVANIILVEDQTIVLEALKMLIEEKTEHRVVATFNHPADVLRTIKNSAKTINLAIIDVRLPDINGIELIGKIQTDAPHVKTILLSQYANREYIKAGIEHGASGYLLKSVAPDELMTAIEWVMEGRQYFCRKATKALLQLNEAEKLNMTLSPREKEVLIQIAKGFTVKEISTNLKIKQATVNHYKECIRSKLQLKKITDMTRYAYESGLIDLGSL